jgi:hypothetical protein
MFPTSEARKAVAWCVPVDATHGHASRQVVDRWMAGEAPAVIASDARIPLEDVESILLTVLFDFE